MPTDPNSETTVKRDRPTKDPGGILCDRCQHVFIGEPWHMLCAVCVAEEADALAKMQANG
jgi:Zn finger protein HypA/HybF involved in hydrogenase expression